MNWLRPAGCAVFLCVALQTGIAAAAPDLGELLQEAEREVSALDGGEVVARATGLLEIAQLHGRLGNRKKSDAITLQVVELVKSVEFSAGIEDGYRFLFIVEIARTQARNGDVTGALNTVRLMGEPERKYFALLDMTTALAEQGRIESASVTAQRIPDAEGDWKAQALSEIGQAYAKSGDFASMRGTLRQIDELRANHEGDRRLIDAYKNHALYAIVLDQADRRRIERASAVADSIDDTLLRMHAYRGIAEAQAAHHDPCGAICTLRAAVRFAEENRLTDHVGQIAELQAKAGDLCGAVETTSRYLSGIDAGGAKLVISIAYAQRCCQQAATASFEDGLALIHAGNVGDQSYLLGDMAVTQVKGCQLDRALKVADLIDDEFMRNYALGQIVAELAKQGNVVSAMKVAESIEADTCRAEAFREVGAAQGDRGAARKSFKEAFRVAREVPIGGGTDVIVLYQVGRAQGAAGFAEDAVETFAVARQRARLYADDSYIAQLLQEIAGAQAKSGDVEGALSAARGEASPLFRLGSLIGVIDAMVRDLRGR